MKYETIRRFKSWYYNVLSLLLPNVIAFFWIIISNHLFELISLVCEICTILYLNYSRIFPYLWCVSIFLSVQYHSWCTLMIQHLTFHWHLFILLLFSTFDTIHQSLLNSYQEAARWFIHIFDMIAIWLRSSCMILNGVLAT